MISFAVLLMASLSESEAAIVRTVGFHQSDGFDVTGGTNPSVLGASEYDINGLKISVENSSFLYAQLGSGRRATPNDDTNTALANDSTSLGTSTIGIDTSRAITFTLSLSEPFAGHTFDLLSMNLAGYSDFSTGVNQSTSIEFIGYKLGSMVTSPSIFLQAGSRDKIAVNFADFGGFTELTHVSWTQGGQFQAHQFDDITFATAIPEPSGLIAILGVVTGLFFRKRRGSGPSPDAGP